MKLFSRPVRTLFSLFICLLANPSGVVSAAEQDTRKTAAAPAVEQPQKSLRALGYLRRVNREGGIVTIGVCVDYDGTITKDHYRQLKAIGDGLHRTQGTAEP